MSLNEYPLWTAVITPMNADSSVNYDDLKKLIEEQDQAKNGLLILGSTGESLNLDLEEKKQILEYVISLKPNSPIMVGVGGVNLNTTKSWVEYLNGLNVDAYLMVTPLYAKPERHGQTSWFKALMDLSQRPVMLYNVPSRTGRNLDFDTVRDLKDHPKLWAIKEASGSASDFQQYREAAPKAKVYSGDDAMLPVFALHGASGLVSVASNAWPTETHAYTQACLNNSLNDQGKNLWEKCSNSLFIKSNPIPVKRLIADEGRISTSNLRLPLDHRDLEDGAVLAESSREIRNWYQTQKG